MLKACAVQTGRSVRQLYGAGNLEVLVARAMRIVAGIVGLRNVRDDYDVQDAPHLVEKVQAKVIDVDALHLT